MSEAVNYWFEQLRAALDGMEPDVGLRAHHNADEVVINPLGSTRKGRAELIRALERRGFTVTSTTSEEYIHVDATAEPLAHPFTDTPHPRAGGGDA